MAEDCREFACKSPLQSTEFAGEFAGKLENPGISMPYIILPIELGAIRRITGLFEWNSV